MWTWSWWFCSSSFSSVKFKANIDSAAFVWNITFFMCVCSGMQQGPWFIVLVTGQVPSSGFAINQPSSRTLQAYQVTDQFSWVCVHIWRRCTAHELDLGDSAPAAFLRSNSRQTFPRWSRWKYVFARGTSWQQGERRDKRLLLWELLCLRVVASIEGKMQTFEHACFIRQIRITTKWNAFLCKQSFKYFFIYAHLYIYWQHYLWLQ